MTDRRAEILDTALHVLAEHGMRGLTHRAVDAAAGLPSGSTSYYFRTRDALVGGCLRRLLELDRADLPDELPPGVDLDTLVVIATALCLGMIGEGRFRTLARYELSLHAVRDPALHRELVAAGDELRALGAALLGAVGAADPAATSERLMAMIDGLVYTAIVRPPTDPASWFAGPIRDLVTASARPGGQIARQADRRGLA
ncbi:MAG TPA: TetR family transcriptional regulator [Pseudonocardiaceae bacterium]